MKDRATLIKSVFAVIPILMLLCSIWCGGLFATPAISLHMNSAA